MEFTRKEARELLKAMENPSFKEALTSLADYSSTSVNEEVREKLSKLSKISKYTVSNLLDQAKRTVVWALTCKSLDHIEIEEDWAKLDLKIGNYTCTFYSDLIAPEKFSKDTSEERAGRHNYYKIIGLYKKPK